MQLDEELLSRKNTIASRHSSFLGSEDKIIDFEESYSTIENNKDYSEKDGKNQNK